MFMAMLLKFGPLLFSLIPHIPDAVNMVEKLAGPTQGNGAVKAATALSFVQGVVPTLEDAFQATPEVRNIVTAGIHFVYEIMKSTGHLTAQVPADSPVVAVAVAQGTPAILAQPI